MRIWIVLAAAAVLWGCGDGDDGNDFLDGDVTLDWGEWPDLATDTAADTPTDDGSDPDTDPVITGPGEVQVAVPSDVAGDDGIAIRVSYPAREDLRHEAGAPVVVLVPGGHGAGSLGYDEPDPLALATSTVVIDLILPGGMEPGYWSGGEYDYRGPDCKAALRDVVRYAAGEIADQEGHLITDRVPFVDVSVLGLVGMSHGGNLALTALADHAAGMSAVDFLATWESPVGDQYVTGELGTVGDPADNPYYEPGTCTQTICPWPGMDTVLRWATGYDSTIVDPLDGTIWPISGAFFLDVDGNEVLGDTEFIIRGIPGPGEWREGNHLPYLYYSTEMASILDGELATFFPLGKPVWMASPDQIRGYWAERDGSTAIADVHAAFPDLMVMVLGTVEDHVQVQPDHPHLRSQMDAWLGEGHGWVRLNPDAEYMALVSGEDPGSIVEQDAGMVLAFPDTETYLVPESLGDHVVGAAVLELVDRVSASNTDADLDSVLF